MDPIEKNTKNLISSIRKSSIYREYKRQEEKLMENPELFQRVDQFRSDNFRLQNESPKEDLFQVAEHLERESAELRTIPEVNAFLDAELALCKLMQKICLDLTEGIKMHVPDF